MSRRVAARVRRCVAGLAVTVAALAAAPWPAAASAPPEGSASVTLAGFVSPAAPDAATIAQVDIPLTVTNTGDSTLYDVTVSSLRSAPITDDSGLTGAFTGDAITESEFTKRGPVQDLPKPLAPGASVRVDYRVDSSDESTGICLCVLGVYALDLVVSGAESEGGETGPVARTQTYLPSLTADRTADERVGWLWPLLDRPHRLAGGSVFVDDDLATSVGPGGRLDRALAAVERVDATAAERRSSALARSMLLLIDPELVAELVTMTRGYTVQAADGSKRTGTGGDDAAQWLGRLAAVAPRHDLRLTAPADPDLIDLAARGVDVETALDDDDAGTVAEALGREELPPSDLAWPATTSLDSSGLATLTAAGARAVVTGADTADDGSVATLRSGDTSLPALLDDPGTARQATAAVSNGADNAASLQRLVAVTAMTNVVNPTTSRFVLLAPGRTPDVDPDAAAAAVVATADLGTPTSPVAALADTADVPTRSDLLGGSPAAPPEPLGAALDAAVRAQQAEAAVRAVAVSGADGVVADLPARIQRVASYGWLGAPQSSGVATAQLDARASSLTSAVQVVVRPSGTYSLASADAPLLLTVANDLPVPVRITVDVRAAARSQGLRATAAPTVVIPAGARPTVRVPTSVTRSGRFDVDVTLRAADGTPVGAPAQLAVTSTAVGAVGQVVTYAAGILLALALLVRGVRRVLTREKAGSAPEPARGDDDDATAGTSAPGGPPTVRTTP